MDDALDAIASVRRHSRVTGFNNCIAMLMGMGTPLPALPEEEQPTYEPSEL